MKLRKPPETAKNVELPLRLLGEGDLTGRYVVSFGHIWRIWRVSYLGSWCMERFEDRPDGRWRVASSCGAYMLLPEHPHYAELTLVAPEWASEPITKPDET